MRERTGQSQKQRSRAKTAALLLLFAGAFLFVGWSIFWALAHRAATGELKAWLDWEARNGRTWSCQSMTTGGYPLSIDIDCSEPSMRAGKLSVTARRAMISAPLYTPKLVTINLTGPGEAIADTQFRANWKRLEISTRGLPERLDRLSVSGEGALLEGDAAAASPTRILAISSQWKRASVGANAPYSFAISLAGVENSALDAVTGTGDPAVIAAIGAVTQVDRAVGASLPERTEAWRDAGGRVGVQLLAVRKGPLGIQAEGTLGLDQSRRLDGKLDFTLNNFGTILTNFGSRFGLEGPIAAAMSLLGAMPGQTSKQGEMRVGIAFENGAVSVGPLKRVLSLPPVY